LGRLLGQQGYFCAQLGRYEEADQLLEQSLSMLRSLVDVSALANTLTLFAYTKYRLGEFKDASMYAQESLALNRSLNNQVGIAYCFINLSYIYLAEEAYERAYTLSLESLAICRDILGDPHGTEDSLITLSTAAAHLGRYVEAKRWAEQGLQISQTLNDRWGIGQTLRELGLISYRLGEVEQAETLIRQSVSQFREIGDRPLMAMTLIGLGTVIHAARKNSEAKECFLSALRIAMATQSEGIALQALLEIAAIEKEEGTIELALELSDQCLKHPAASQEIKDRAGNLRAELKRKLPSQQMGAGHELAQGNTFEAVVREILSESG
jgi:tetratricopeptide (TPR) repeat protein